MTQTTRESMRSALISTLESFSPECLTLEVENILDDLIGTIEDQEDEHQEDLEEEKFKYNLSPEYHELKRQLSGDNF